MSVATLIERCELGVFALSEVVEKAIEQTRNHPEPLTPRRAEVGLRVAGSCCGLGRAGMIHG